MEIEFKTARSISGGDPANLTRTELEVHGEFRFYIVDDDFQGANDIFAQVKTLLVRLGKKYEKPIPAPLP